MILLDGNYLKKKNRTIKLGDFMTTKEFQEKMKKIEYENKQYEMKQKLKQAKAKNKSSKKLTTSKIVLLVVFLLNLQIVWFVEKAIMTYGDLSALYALIGMPVTIIPIVLGYFNKSKAENTAGGIVYDSAIMSQSFNMDQNISDDNSVG